MMTYNDIRHICKSINCKQYVDTSYIDADLDNQVSTPFESKNEISDVSIIMVDANNPIRDLALKISTDESTIKEIVETLIIDIIQYYKEDLDIRFVYDSVMDIDSIVNDIENTIPLIEIDMCIDYMYKSVFSKDNIGEIVAFVGWSANDTILNFMVN